MSEKTLQHTPAVARTQLTESRSAIRGGTAAVESPYLSFVDTRCCGRIVAVIPPRRVIEVDNKIAIVGGDRFVEDESPNARPIAKPTPLEERRAERGALVRHLDLKS
jgi:hypothetical protein